jgi:hypothetical protein
MDLVADFFDTARARLEAAVQPTSDYDYTNGGYNAPQSSLGGALFEAIYQFGAGKAEQARDSLTSQFLKTGEGQRLQQSATRQTIAQYAPLLVGFLIVLFLMGFTVGRK